MVRESGLGKAIGHVAAAVTLAAAALLCASPAAQADDWIYLQRDSTGLRSFTDVKPGGHYRMREIEPFGKQARLNEVRGAMRGLAAKEMRNQDQCRTRRLRKVAELRRQGIEEPFSGRTDLWVNRDRNGRHVRPFGHAHGFGVPSKKQGIVTLVPDAFWRNAQFQSEQC